MRTVRRVLSGATLVALVAYGAGVNAAGGGGGGGGGGAIASATGANLKLVGATSTGSPAPGAAFTYKFAIKNLGPDTATDVTFSEALALGVGYQAAVATGGSTGDCTSAPDASGAAVVTCVLGALASGASAGVVVTATAPDAPAAYPSTASVTATSVDPVPADNQVSLSVTVKAAAAPAPAVAVAPAAPPVVAFTDLGDVAPPADGNGYSLAGVQPSGLFSFTGFQFTPTASGALSLVRLPIHQFDIGGNGTFQLQIYADNAAAPGTLGALLSSTGAQALRTVNPSTGITSVVVARGPLLTAGSAYWVVVKPTSKSRLAWAMNAVGAVGPQVLMDNTQVGYTTADLGAVEVVVVPQG